MTTTKFDKIETAFIAKMICDRLDLPYQKKTNRRPAQKSRRLSKVIKDIEKIEKSWGYVAEKDEPTYGRKQSDEIIRLWSVPKKTAEVLESLVRLTGATKILEIGTSAGYSTLHLANGAKVNKGMVYTIESMNIKINLAKTYFSRSGLDNIRLLEGPAENILRNWRHGKVDFVFLDADKENYGQYLNLLLPLIKKNSLIVADNINDYGHLMQNYLQKVTGTHLAKSRVDKRVKSYYLAALDNGLMITKKISD